MEKVRELIHQIVIRHFDIKGEKLSPETHFQRDLGADSVDMILIILAIENTFGVSIPEDQMGELTTTAKSAAVIAKHL